MAASWSVAAIAARRAQGEPVAAQTLSVYTFGDSVLDCGRYNAYGVHPGQLVVRNDDRLFPEFKGRDLQSRRAARLVHGAVDGSTVDGLLRQLCGVVPKGACIALLTVGGNDLIRGLASDTGAGMRRFERALEAFLQSLSIRPVLMGNVYDPTFGDDARNFLGVPAPPAPTTGASTRSSPPWPGAMGASSTFMRTFCAVTLRGSPR